MSETEEKSRNRLTREDVNVNPGVQKYFSEGPTPMISWGERMIDLQGETYAALKRYEDIGPMASPFVNSATSIMAIAFKELYPDIKYEAQFVERLGDEEGEAYGVTVYPEEGTDQIPIILISEAAPIYAAPELLAHELAHVVAGIEDEHGPKWEAAYDAINKRYKEMDEAMEAEWNA